LELVNKRLFKSSIYWKNR